MVTINQKAMVNTNGWIQPLMHKHNLKVTKDAPTFETGEVVECYIAEYDNGRFCVFSASGVKKTKYHVFESAEELHEHFEEL